MTRLVDLGRGFRASLPGFGALRSTRATEGTDPAATADTVLRVAVLLHAGVAAGRVWAYLAETGDPAAASIHADIARGAGIPDAIGARGLSWREIGAAWRVAETVGAPLAESLRAIAVALRDAQEAADEIRVALAEPAGTAKLMGWLPFVAIVMGVGLGFDTIGVLVRNPLGVACLVAGAGCVVAARRWTRALVVRARAGPGIPGMHAELLAIGLSGGVSMDRARAIVTGAFGSPATESGDPPEVDGSESVEKTLALSRSAGVPAVELLRASASLARHRARTAGRLRAAALSSRLLLPLGVCTLPAFLLLGAAPMLLSVMSSTSLTM